MGWRGAGLKVLRWIVWILFGWVFLRGIFSFVPTPAAVDGAGAGRPGLSPVAEPAGLSSFPAMFAREYLTWQPGRSEDRAVRLQPFLAQNLDRQAGWAAGRNGTGQTAEAVWVHAVKSLADGRWLVTVAARVAPFEESQESEGSGWRTVRKSLAGAVQYLAVPISPFPGAGWVVYDYPSLVSIPAPGEFTGALHSGQEVSDEGDRVKTLLNGFFRAYLAGAGDSSYYAAPDTKLPPLRSTLAFQAVSRVTLVKAGDAHDALAEVQALDPTTGARYTYRYTLRLTEREGRWYIKDLLQKGD